MIITGNEQLSENPALQALAEREIEAFAKRNPASRHLYEEARGSMIGGVPMQWMSEWPGAFPLFGDRAEGARVWDADGNEYIDFCLGDTGAMFGHAIPAIADVVADQSRNGITCMLPSADGVKVAQELQRRFSLAYWQIAMTATDANRFLLRFAREVTKRPKVLVFQGCYHGTVDETIVSLVDGKTASRSGNLGPPVDPSMTTRVVEFNDLESLERALADKQVACVMTEPALTNIGIVLPEPGFLEGVRELTRQYGTLLAIDETHTISTGPSGYTGAYRLEPDMLTLGKPLAGGVPAAVFGMSQDVGEAITKRTIHSSTPVAGIGGTLSANWLAVRAMRIMLEQVITEEAYAHMIAVAERLSDDVTASMERHGLPWHATRLGARMEYRFQPRPPRNGSESALGGAGTLDAYIHLYCLNRGIMITPMHNMLLASPATSLEDAAFHAEVFEDCIAELSSTGAVKTDRRDV